MWNCKRMLPQSSASAHQEELHEGHSQCDATTHYRGCYGYFVEPGHLLLLFSGQRVNGAVG